MPIWVALIIGFLVIFSAVLLAIGLGWRWFESRRKAQVTKVLETTTGQVAYEKVTILRDRLTEEGLTKVLASLPLYASIEKKIEQSGLAWTPMGLLTATLVSAVIGLFIGTVLPILFTAWITAPALAIGFATLPYLWLMYSRSRRLAAFEEQFPEALDFLSRSMRAGHAFSVSLEMLADESIPPLSLEFRRIFNEQNLGSSLDSALKNMAARVPLVDVRFFVSAVLLQKETGGNLSEILLKLAYVIRERFRLKGQVRAASAHGRVTGVVLTALPLVLTLALLVIAPGYLQGMAKDPDGKYLIAGSILGQIVGYCVIRRIVNIKV
jgi:tight adherence protein B